MDKTDCGVCKDKSRRAYQGLIVLFSSKYFPPSCGPTSRLMTLWTSSVQKARSGEVVGMPAPGIECWLIKWVIDEITVVFHPASFSISSSFVSVVPQLWDWLLESPTRRKLLSDAWISSRESSLSFGQ